MPGDHMPPDLKCTEHEQRRDGHDEDAPLPDEEPYHEGKDGTDQAWRDAVPHVIEKPGRIESKLTAQGDQSPIDRKRRRGQDLQHNLRRRRLPAPPRPRGPPVARP